jgi:hypothetical protein
MSVQRSTELEISSRGKTRVDLLKALFKSGWTPYSPAGDIEYTDLGDKDRYDYQLTKDIGKAYGI